MPAAAQRFFDVARNVDACVCMSSRYADALRQAGIRKVHVIVPGVDLDLYRPVVRIGVVGRTYPTGRKGEDLVKQVMDEPGIEWHFTGEGWPGPARYYSPEEMPDFYNSVDYILVPSYYEGGPMSVLEALACGKEVIAPPIGFVSDYPHIEYATGDADDLRRVLRELVAKRMALRKSVSHRTWDAWATAHDALFREMLSARKAPAVISKRSDRLRVLLATHSPENVAHGGPTIRMRKTKEALEKLGVAVDITMDDLPDAKGYDLVHVFNVWAPEPALAQLRHLKRFNIPIVFSPIYLDLSETAWAYKAIPSIFHQARSPEELQRYLAAASDGSLVADGISRFARNEIIPGYFAQVREMIELSDHLIALSNFEMERLWAAGVSPRPFTLVRNAVDFARFARAPRDLFASKYGVRDYVLCVGRLEIRKNQLMLVHALRETDLPVVLIGHPAEPDYVELIRRYSGPNVLFVGRLPHDDELLASAYAGARVFVLPSWSEGAPLTALEAAAAGVALALSDRSSESEYFGDLAVYCDPGSIDSIREAVLKAYEVLARDDAYRQALQAKVRTTYTWENAAHDTLQAYTYALETFRPRHVQHHTLNHPRRLEIGSGMNPQPGYEHLDIRRDLPHLEYVHDINQPLPFDEGTFDEILSRSCLEHISWRKVIDLLRDWRRVLKPGGMLRIWMPDLEYLCRAYLSGKSDEHLDSAYIAASEKLLGGYTPAAWAIIKMFGGQDYPDNFHRAVYDFATFSRILQMAGFERIERLPPYHGLHLVAYRPQPDKVASSQESPKVTAAATTLHHPSTSPPALLWHAPIYDPSGYADEARHFIMHLQAQGVEVAARELGRHSSKFREQLDPQARHRLDRALRQEVRPGCISVVHFPAYAFKRVPQAAYHIGRVMFETDGLPAEWVAKCNQMDEIWVPTDFNLQTFRDAGVTAKLFKVPGGIDTNRFRPGYDPLPISGARGVVFLSIFEWIYRKGWDALLRAWAKAFGPEDDVCLVLRTYPVNAPDAADARREIERRIDHFLEEELGLRREDVASIIVLGEQIPEADMPRLFAAATAYVAPSRGEGWGRPQMQAMACGLPVIATRWSGNLEFMDDENSLLIDIEGLVEIDERAEIPFYRGQRWAEPSVDHLAALLRWVVERPEEAAQIGRRAREDMERHWRWEKVTAIAIERLRAIEAELAQRRQRSSAHPAQAIAVRWEGSLFVYHSLALVNRELCLQLIDAGCELSIIPYEPDQFGPEADPRFWKLAARVNAPLSRPVDVHVRHQWPPNLNPPPEGHWVIIQPWEFGSLPKQWVEVMSTQVDEVWVPSSYVRDCYIRSGVPADRVYVVPNGVDTAKFRPGAPPLALKTKKRFKFLFVGGTIPRKGIDILLDVYMKAFTAEDDVCLVIKDMGGSSFYKGQTAQDLITKCQAMPNAPEIEYIDRTLSDEELVGLYTACDCLVHPYRGEGFGLPIAEAMACGLPVIVTGYGAALDFCTEETAYLVPAREVRLPQKRVGDLETVDYPWWADPDREALKRLMQHVVANPDEAKAKGQAARAHIRAHFTWERAAEVVRKRLQELRDKPIRRLAAEDERATVQELVNELLAEGQAALEQGDLEAAAREFARVVEQYPDLAAAHTALGSTLVALGRIEEAIPHLRRATELAPQAAALHNQLGVALYQMNDLEGAEAAFRRAREADPQDVEALLNLVDLYRVQGRYVEATGAIKEAVEVNPNHLDVLSTFGFMSMEMGDIEGAQIALRRMQAVGPDHPKTQAFAQVLARLAEDGHDGNSVIDSALAASGPSRDH
ncbi:MAG TPA: glycosyltransferase [Caldilineae bacterium]|nr:glycosyltransferase [Caldilineae bacterium]